MHKIISTFVLVVAINSIALSQIEKNTWMIGGSGNAYFGTNPSFMHITLNPNAGYFISDNWAIGLSSLVTTGFSSSAFGLIYVQGIYTRYYLNLSERVSLFPELRTGAGLINKDSGGNFKMGYNSNLAFGASFWINKNVAFEPKIDYTLYGSDIGSFVGPPLRLPTLNLGFQIYINRGEKKSAW